MERPVAYRGSSLTVVFAVCSNGTSPGQEFYEQLGGRDKAKMNKLFEWIGERGWINNKERFKRIEGTEFFEFKDFQIRMPCYRSGNLLIVTHGFFKKRDAIPPQQIERARRIKREDESLFKTGQPLESRRTHQRWQT